MRGGPPQHVANVLDEAKAIAGRELGATDEGTRPWGYTPAASDEPKPNSPADVGFVDQDEARPPPQDRPLHEPHACKGCRAAIFWAALLDHQGERINRADGKGWKSIPVNAEPDPKGNVVLFHREGQGIVARILKRGEAAPRGAKLRLSHFATCEYRTESRRSR